MISKLFRVITLLPIAYWIYLPFFGDLGADPAKTLNHLCGEFGLYYIILNLLIGALINFKFKWPSGLRFLLINRRWLGVLSFFILVAHVALYFTMEAFEFQAIEQMYTKNYLIVGSLAFFMIFLMALTSNDFSVRKLGAKRWKRFHRIVYFASLLFTIHIMMIEKADLVKYGIVLGSLWAVQIFRLGFVIRNRVLKARAT